MANNKINAVISLVSLAMLAACGGGEAEAPVEEESAPDMAAEESAPVAEAPGLPRSAGVAGSWARAAMRLGFGLVHPGPTR